MGSASPDTAPGAEVPGALNGEQAVSESVTLKTAIATTAPMNVVAQFPAVGRLQIVCGRYDDPAGRSLFHAVVRAPGAPDLLILSAPWPEGEPDAAWSAEISQRIEQVRAALAIAAKRREFLTDEPDGPTVPDLGAA